MPLTISENSTNNVIKVYYVKDKFSYSVEYYYNNVKDDYKTATGTAEYQSTIDSYTDKNITGYKFDKTENFPLTISENPADNVIKVYYIIDDGNTRTLTYTVEYYKDNEKVEGDTETRTKTVQILEPYTLELDRNLINDTNKYVGYKLDRTDPINVPDIVNDGDVIKVYYVKDSFGYTVEYYYDNVKDNSKTETGTAEYQSIIGTYEDKKINGFEFDKTENLPLTISENSSNNIIRIYYYPIRTITINHIDINTNEILETEEEKGKEGKLITTAAIDITGYTLVKKPEIEEYTLKAESQIVNYYYAKLSSGVVEKHINIVTDELVADDRVYEGYTGKDYLTKSKQISDYDLVTNEKYYRIKAEKDENLLSDNGVTTVEELLQKLSLNATDIYVPGNYKGKMTEELIEVKYYYVKKAKVIVQYLDKNSNKPIHNEETINGHEKDPYSTKPIEIEGYDLVKEPNYYPTKLEGEMTEEPIIIVLYYERKTEVEVKHICILDDSIINTSKIEGHEKETYRTQMLDRDEYSNYRILNNKEYYEYATKKDKNILTENNVTSVKDLLEKLGLNEINPYIPENSSGEMTAEKILVNYYYKKQATIVVKHIDEDTGEEIASLIDVLDYGDEYSILPINFQDYIINESKMPTNYTGIVKKDTEEIIYYYKRVKEDNTKAKGEIPQTGDNLRRYITYCALGITVLMVVNKIRKKYSTKMNKLQF